MTVLPNSVTRRPEWDEKFDLLEELCRSKATTNNNDNGVDRSSKCFWLVTSNPQLNEWLVYNRIELNKKRRQQDPIWQERRQRLAQLGFHFGP